MSLKSGIKKLIFRLRGTYTVEQLVKMGLTVGKNFNPQLGYDLDPSHCWLITIGDDVCFAPHVRILAHDASMHQFLGYTKIGRVTIGDRVFIGADSVVLPGVTIGSDVVVGAGSVVTKDIPAGEVYAGNPARFLCKTADFVEKHRQAMQTAPVYDESFTLRGNIADEQKQQQKQELNDREGYVI